MNQGAAVAGCGRSETALERFSRAHSDALAIKADVTIGEARIAMLKSVADRFGRLDILINNAGTFVERNFAADADHRNCIPQLYTLARKKGQKWLILAKTQIQKSHVSC
jgi:NADP-dependent 3-hydroxy acid dehydrogenase YdfG